MSVKKCERDKKLYLATADVMSGELSLREASEKYGIPKSTIWDRASGKVAFGAISGPPKYLNSVEEEHLVKFLIGAAKIGFPRSKKQVLAIVRAILAKKRACNIEDVQVSPGWWGSFKKRHPMLTLRSGSKVAFRRAMACTPDTINSYFDILEEAIKSNNLQNSPMYIYNCDESGFPLEHKPCKAIGLRGQRDLPCLTSGDKTQLTVLSACSASGYLLPPMIIFDRKRLKPAFTVGEVPGTAYGLSKKGWIDSELFEDWFTNHFLLHIPPQRPVLLLVDGHSSHYQPQLIRKAVQNHVILFCLPPHTTHLCQPLDRTCFSSLKSAYYDQCQQFASENPGEVVNRSNFTQIFCRAWTRAMTPANIIAGFRATGVFPLNRYAVLRHISDISGECETADLADQMGIFVPLYSPMKKSGPNVMSDEDEDDDDEGMIDSSDDVDDTSPQEQDNEEKTTSTKKPEEPSYISELLVLPKPPAQSARCYTARVLTSQENIKAIEEKEREKARKEEEKELRKMEREKKKVEQERKKMERQMKRQVNNRKEVAFTKEEHQRYTLRHENGYDIPEERYCQWLKIYYPDDRLVASSNIHSLSW